MYGDDRRLLSLLLTLMLASAAFAQPTSSFQPTQPPPPPPAPLVPAIGGEAPPPPPVAPLPGRTYPLPPAPVPAWNQPQPYCPPPAAPVYPVYPTRPVQRQVPTVATEGPFASAEFMMSRPTLEVNSKEFPVLNQALPNAVPATDLSSFISPTFELGYRFATKGDYVAASYRFLYTDGSGPENIGGVVTLPVRTSLHINQWDFDYGTRYDGGPRSLWSFNSRLGVRFFNLNYNSSVDTGAADLGIKNSYWGAGPHLRFDTERKFAFFPDLSLYSRLDGALILGQNTRTAYRHVGGSEVSAEDSFGQGVPMLNSQFGLSYSPEDVPGLVITGGYVYEHWWSIGQLSTSEGNSFFNSGQLYSHGWFLRAQIDF